MDLPFDPVDPPRWHGPAIGTARFKSRPEDFQVDERLGFEPSGDGEHCLAWIEKTDRNSNDIAAELAGKLGVRKRLISHCGLKDKSAITRQWFSLHLPGQPSPPIDELAGEGWRAILTTRNLRKLHRGSHDGNRFQIRLHDCFFTADEFADRWRSIVARGVPNYFGPQRFGSGGSNISLARQFMAGEVTIRDRALRGILISAARSFVFNACVARRVIDRTWDTPLDGEVFGFTDNRSLILPTNLHGDEPARFAAGRLELTAPLWGEGDPVSASTVAEIEQSVVESCRTIVGGLGQFNLRQERRVIRLRPSNATATWADSQTVDLCFDLPKGTYATTVLQELVALKEGALRELPAKLPRN